uniref:Intraflagellar transport protein 46 homolog n=1 Tax=Daphnia longispina TaxID=42846 RepID=A0A4Y7M811_9CRUS|nr:EOG090X0FP3 [Daphnia longispina]
MALADVIFFLITPSIFKHRVGSFWTPSFGVISDLMHTRLTKQTTKKNFQLYLKSNKIKQNGWYRPHILEMETKLKPFLPDFIPAVGDPDAFLKIDRPDEYFEFLGLTVIDEPSLSQSDPSVLDLRLRSIYKQISAKTTIARSVEEENKTKVIDKWIKDINDLHRLKPLPSVTYYKSLPDIDALLQEWNSDVEETLGVENLLSSDIDCDLLCFIDVACGPNKLTFPLCMSISQMQY